MRSLDPKRFTIPLEKKLNRKKTYLFSVNITRKGKENRFYFRFGIIILTFLATTFRPRFILNMQVN